MRLGNVYGPRQNSKGEAGVVAIFIDKFLKGQQPIINGKGTQTRDYVYVKDVARAFVLAQKAKHTEAFNIGTGKETSVNDIFDAITKALKTSNKKKYGPFKKGDQMRSCLDCKKAKRLLGWSPKYKLDQGISETVEWFKTK